MVGKPADFTIVLALGMYGRRVCADEVRGQLKKFGFDCTAQQVGAWLRRLSREDLPPVELRKGWPVNSYMLTRWGWNELREGGLKQLGMPVAFPAEGSE